MRSNARCAGVCSYIVYAEKEGFPQEKLKSKEECGLWHFGPGAGRPAYVRDPERDNSGNSSQPTVFRVLAGGSVYLGGIFHK